MSKDMEFNESLKEKEIKRLTDSLGKEEPVKGILSDEEILEYAGDSRASSTIRLENGNDDLSDKMNIHKKNMLILYAVLLVPLILSYNYASSGNLFASILFLIIVLAYVNYPLYFLYIKDYAKPKDIKKQELKNNAETTTTNKSNNLQSFNVYKSQIEDLKSLYDAKEKIAKDLIEKRFEPPQITYDRFTSTVDKCTELFNNQVDVALNVINLATEHTPEIDQEIESKIDVLKSIIEKIDSLTNELIVNIGESKSESDNSVKNLLEDMENLIDSVDEYK